MKKVFIILTGLVLSGCSLHSPPPPNISTTQLHYDCDTTPLTVTLNKPARQVSVILDGIRLHLPQVAAASGTKYSDGHYTFWSKGNTALVQRGDDVIIDDCQLSPSY